MREGFWYSKDEPNLPKPKPSNWVGAGRFAKLLSKVQTRAKERRFRGASTCRICGCSNGSSEFSHKGAVWPSGLMHYIVDHNVKPSDRFIQFISKEAKEVP